MQKIILSFALLLMLYPVFAQTPFKQYTAGRPFTISLPEYMSKTSGINDAASIQYKSKVKDVYGFVIQDLKEDLVLAEINFSSIKDYSDKFIGELLKDQEKRQVSAPIYKTVGGINFVELDASYFDKDAQMEISYIIGLVETKNAYYKVFSWSSLEAKNNFKADFQKIIYSLKD